MNPYLAYAATIAAGLHGIEHGIEPPPALRRQRVRGPEVEHGAVEPRRGDRRVREHRRSRRDAFGADVHDHLLNTARQECAHFNRAVTDWERRRNFERI